MNQAQAASAARETPSGLPSWLAERFEWIETLHSGTASIVDRARDRQSLQGVVIKRPGPAASLGRQRLQH